MGENDHNNYLNSCSAGYTERVDSAMKVFLIACWKVMREAGPAYEAGAMIISPDDRGDRITTGIKIPRLYSLIRRISLEKEQRRVIYGDGRCIYPGDLHIACTIPCVRVRHAGCLSAGANTARYRWPKNYATAGPIICFHFGLLPNC